MPIHRPLEGSCQCGGVHFTIQSHTPVPYQLCACSICRKCGSASGSINIGGIASSLQITRGADLIKKYNAIADRGTASEKVCGSERAFCSTCATMLWVWDGRWAELIHPFAAAIDSELPKPPEMVCVLAGSKPEWVRWPEGEKSVYQEYGPESLEGWHKLHGLFVE